jgi:hypothetical protein
MLMKPLIVIKRMVGLEKYSESNLDKGYPCGRQFMCERECNSAAPELAQLAKYTKHSAVWCFTCHVC